jgi:predicted DNA-binding transcriptional regulator YafY
VLETSARLLRELALLQARPDWPGPDLAARLGVSPRTLTVAHPQADGGSACILHTGAESPDVLAIYVSILGAEFEILDPPELAAHIVALAGRLTRAARHRAVVPPPTPG